jgi:hypothetical protein
MVKVDCITLIPLTVCAAPTLPPLSYGFMVAVKLELAVRVTPHDAKGNSITPV